MAYAGAYVTLALPKLTSHPSLAIVSNVGNSNSDTKEVHHAREGHAEDRRCEAPQAEGLSRNIPPLNTILANSTDEILPSEVDADEFDIWWAQGEDISTFKPD